MQVEGHIQQLGLFKSIFIMVMYHGHVLNFRCIILICIYKTVSIYLCTRILYVDREGLESIYFTVSVNILTFVNIYMRSFYYRTCL